MAYTSVQWLVLIVVWIVAAAALFQKPKTKFVIALVFYLIALAIYYKGGTWLNF